MATAAYLVVCQPAAGAELRLRRECRAAAPVVTLGDVAEVFAATAAETARLESIELFPAPAPSGQRFLRLRELEDLLLLKGLDLSQHRFSGSSQVTIRSEPAEAGPAAASRGAGLTSAALRLASRRLEEAIAEWLQAAAPQPDPAAWLIHVEPSPDQARWLAKPEAVVTAVATGKSPLSSGAAGAAETSAAFDASPLEGRRLFQVTVETPEDSVRFTVEAQVGLPAQAVVTASSLPRGSLIQEADVELVRVPPGEHGQDPVEGFRRIEEVVGRETTRSVPAGKLLTAELIREPLLVRRGDVVTVCARAGGVCVRTMARARDDGSRGDLVAVESLSDRTTYYTRVVRPREVEVYARARQASESQK